MASAGALYSYLRQCFLLQRFQAEIHSMNNCRADVLHEITAGIQALNIEDC